MAFYQLDAKVRDHLGTFLSNVNITGDEATKIVEVAALLENRKDFPFVEISDEHIGFMLGKLDKIEIKGSLAMILVSVQIALKRPLPKLPEKKVAKTTKTKKPEKKVAKTTKKTKAKEFRISSL